MGNNRVVKDRSARLRYVARLHESLTIKPWVISFEHGQQLTDNRLSDRPVLNVSQCCCDGDVMFPAHG
jgi:hypothetical protein